MSAVDIAFRYLSSEEDRHGNERLYVRRYGRRIRIREAKGSKVFAQAYARALERLDELKAAATAPGPARQQRPTKSFGWLAVRYLGSDEFTDLDPTSQRQRKNVIDACLKEPHTDDDADPMGNCPLSFMTSKKIKRLRDLKKGLPGAANNRRKYLSTMFAWGIENDVVASNPVRDVRRKKYATNGFYTWTLDDLKVFLECHGPGTRARLYLGLLLFLGVRRGDAVRLGARMVHPITTLGADGKPVESRVLRFIPNKTRHQRVVESEKPVLPVLEQILATSPLGTDTFLETSFGKPFSAKGVGNFMRDRCDEAGLRQCSAHGLRKLGATIAAELNATEHQLMAMFDWSTPQQAAVYTRAAKRGLLARGAMPLLATLGISITTPPPSTEKH